MIQSVNSIDLIRPYALSTNRLTDLVDKHINDLYKSGMAARLSVLAIYAAYKCLISETKRFDDKQLLPIESHSSSAKSSNRIGDIDIIDEQEKVFESVEVKHGISISLQLVQDAYAKFHATLVKRYYILTTWGPTPNEIVRIEEEIEKIRTVHGCQLIVNGITPTLRYYLRLFENSSVFTENYVNLIEADNALTFEHKEHWNRLIREMK